MTQILQFRFQMTKNYPLNLSTTKVTKIPDREKIIFRLLKGERSYPEVMAVGVTTVGILCASSQDMGRVW